MLNSCHFSLPPSTSQLLEVDPAAQSPSLGMPLGTSFGTPAFPLAHLAQLRPCSAVMPGQITSNHIFTLPSCTSREQPLLLSCCTKAKEALRGERFLLLPSPCCFTQATEKGLLTEALFLWLQLEPKPAVLLVSTTQAMHQCEQPLAGSQPLAERRLLFLETYLVSLEWFCAGNCLQH